MKKSVSAVIVSILFSFILSNAFGAEDAFVKNCNSEQIIFSTGIKGNTYSDAVQPLIPLIPNLLCERTDSTGGARNVEYLLGLGGDAEAAIVPADVLEYMARTNPDVKKLRSLMSLWPNSIHPIISKNGYKVDKWKGLSSDTVYVQDFRDLRGTKIAVFGSPEMSARVFDERLKMNFADIDVVDSFDKGLEKVEKGEVAAFLVMGGFPIKKVENLDPKKFTLANVDTATITALGAPYYATRLNYSKIGVNGFNAIATKNEIVVRDYQSPKWIKRYATLYKGIKDNLLDLQEMRGAHPAWKIVSDVDTLFWTPYAPLQQALKQEGVSQPVQQPIAEQQPPPVQTQPVQVQATTKPEQVKKKK